MLMPPDSLISSSRASASARTLMSSNDTPWDERNSFAALQGPQVGLLKTRTAGYGSIIDVGLSRWHAFKVLGEPSVPEGWISPQKLVRRPFQSLVCDYRRQAPPT